MNNDVDFSIIERGRKAKIVTDLPEFHYVIEELKKDLFRRFTSVDLGEAEDITKIHTTTKALTLLVRQLENYVSFGNQESNKLNQEDQAAKE